MLGFRGTNSPHMEWMCGTQICALETRCLTDDGWAPGSDVIDVLVAINVPGVGSLDFVEHDRLAADGLESAYGRRDSSGHQSLSFAENL